jgi:hypothetical protein
VSAENLLLALFAALPLTLGGLLYAFHRTRARRASSGAPALLLGNAIAAALLLSIALLLGELYYRFGFDSTESFALAKTTRRWFDRHFHANESGFRDSVEYLTFAAEGKRRVTFLGDSFTVGHGVANVEDRFANRIRAMRPDWEVQVHADLGLDTGRELELVDYYAANGYELDVVVLVYCLNDIADLVPEWQQVLARIYGSPSPGWLVDNSYLFNTLYYRWRAARDPEISSYYEFVSRNYQGAVWDAQQRRLAALRDQIASGGGRLVVVTFPFVHELGPNYRYRQIHERLDAAWRGLGVSNLDLLGAFENHDPDELVVNSHDAHPNERAHAIAAGAIARFLDAQLGATDPPLRGALP